MKTIPVDAAATKRFLSKVNRSGECWGWQDYINEDGYGVFTIARKPYRAHRVAYVIANGDITDGMEVDHVCLNRACVRPGHLREVTRKQNAEHQAGAQINSKSGVRGVYWIPSRQQWKGTVQHNRRANHAGYFNSIADAETAVLALRNRLFTHNDADRRVST